MAHQASKSQIAMHVICIMLDSLRTDDVGVYMDGQAHAKMTHMDRFAEGLVGINVVGDDLRAEGGQMARHALSDGPCSPLFRRDWPVGRPPAAYFS